MADSECHNSFTCSASASSRADPSPSQRSRQASSPPRGRHSHTDNKLAARRRDVGTYGWSSEEIKRQGRNGRRREGSVGTKIEQGRRSDERPISARRWDHSPEKFVPGGGLPQWSDPFPRPERIGIENQPIVEVTGSIRAHSDLAMRQSGFERRTQYERTVSRQRTTAMTCVFVDQKLGDGASSRKSSVTRSRWGDSPSPDREDFSSNSGNLRSPLRRQPKAFFSANRAADSRESSQGQRRPGEQVVSRKSPLLRTSASSFDAERRPSRGLRGSATRSNEEMRVDRTNSTYSSATRPLPRDSGRREKHLFTEGHAGRGTWHSFSREKSQNSAGHGGASFGHSSRASSEAREGYGQAHSGYSVGFSGARQDGDREHAAQRERMGSAKSRGARGQLTGWMDGDSGAGSGATGTAQGRICEETWAHSRGHSRSQTQNEFRGGGNVEVFRSSNRAHGGKNSWGTDGPSEDNLRNSDGVEGTLRGGHGSQSIRAFTVPEGVVHGSIRTQRPNQIEPKPDNLRYDNRSRGSEKQVSEGAPGESERLRSESMAAVALPRRSVEGNQAETVFLSGRQALNQVREMPHYSSGQTGRSRSSQTVAQPAARRDVVNNVRANWKQVRRTVDKSLAEASDTQVVVGRIEEDIDRVSSFQSIETTGHLQTSRGNDDTANSTDELPKPPTRGMRIRQSSAVYRSIPVDTAGGDGETQPSIVGTCSDMCPARERGRRERLKDLAVLERVNGELGRTSRDLAVKKFCRTLSISDLTQSDVRPLPVLRMTLDYLWGLLDRKDVPFKLVHDFLFDRTRSVRQDICMQQLVGRQAIAIYEEIVRFHIISERELHEQSLSDKYFDSDLNRQQLTKALLCLLDMYATYDFKSGDLPCEAEFHAYFVLLNLGNLNQTQEVSLALWFSTVERSLLLSSEMSFAREALRCYRVGNFERYFQLVRHATYLQACLLELSFNQVRGHALAVLNQSSYKLHPYPIADLAQRLLIAEEDLKALCTFYKLPVGVQSSSQAECLLVKQAQFSAPQKASPWYHCAQIEAKRPPSHLLAVLGTA